VFGLQAHDLELYLERVWNIHLPGYGDPNMRPPVPPAAVNDEARRTAVRQALTELRTEPLHSSPAIAPAVQGGDADGDARAPGAATK
jgi:transcription initiation factor TFIID subunit TAF12